MLTITVTAHNAQPVANPLSANFDQSGGSIGRAPENTLVLLDPDRKISRTHATVAFRDGGYVLRDQGSVVPVMLNQQPLGHGRESPLQGGDEIRIGAYTLKVASSAATARTAPPAADDATVVAVPSAVAVTADTASTPMTEPVLSWSSNAPAAAGEGITTVIMASPENADAAPAAADRAPAPTPASPPPAAAPAMSSATPAAAGTPIANEELLRALLAGAGLKDVEIPGGLTPQLMNQLGQLLQEATRGLVDLLAARASTKREVRADMTVIVAADNNPLKFAPNIEAALTHLLVPRGRGFMPPLRAVTDAYDDLRSHQQGFMAGMRSALAVILARFDPAELEKRLSEHSMVDSFLPSSRKAKLWDLFGQLYSDISKEAASDFQSLLGQEFLRTYREHVARLPDRSDPAPGR